MISKTIAIIKENFLIYALFIVLILIIMAVREAGYLTSGSGVTDGIIWLLLAQMVHRSALFGTKFGARDPGASSGAPFSRAFMLKGLALCLIAVAICIPIVLVSLAGSPLTLAKISTAVVISTIALYFSYVIVMTLAGTWLPAAIYGQNTGIIAAFARGKRYFFSIFFRIVGATIIVGLAILLVGTLWYFSGVQLEVTSATKAINFPGMFFIAMAIFSETVGVTLISVILSYYYLEYEGLTDPYAPDDNSLVTSPKISPSQIAGTGPNVASRQFGKRM